MSGRPIKAVVELTAEDRRQLAVLREHRGQRRRTEVTAICAPDQQARVVATTKVTAPRAATRRTAVRVVELQARRTVLTRAIQSLPELAPRLEAIAVNAPNQVAAVEAEAQLDRLEQLVDDAEDVLASQELVLERVLGGPSDQLRFDPRTARRGADGSLRVAGHTARGGPIGMMLPADNNPGELIVDVARAGFDRFQTAAGQVMGCAAEEEAVQAWAADLRRQGVAIRVVAGPPHAARRRGEATRDAAR